MFPVGELTKAEVRAVAERHRLPTSDKPESMEILLRARRRLRAASWSRSPGRSRRARSSTRAGEVLGPHGGIHRFTVGQRRGLGPRRTASRSTCSASSPRRGRVVVGPASGVEPRLVHAAPAALGGWPPPPDEAVEVRIRHRHAGAPGRVEDLLTGWSP